jgi:hypothetical protein
VQTGKKAREQRSSSHFRIRRDNTWSFMTLEAGHESMVTAPDDLASLLVVI